MEHMEYTIEGSGNRDNMKKTFAIAGVVASGNLEVMIEGKKLDGKCLFIIDTAANGFAASWKAVVTDFVKRRQTSDIKVSINDNAASPAVVSMRLDQAFEDLTTE